MIHTCKLDMLLLWISYLLALAASHSFLLQWIIRPSWEKGNSSLMLHKVNASNAVLITL